MKNRNEQRELVNGEERRVKTAETEKEVFTAYNDKWPALLLGAWEGLNLPPCFCKNPQMLHKTQSCLSAYLKSLRKGLDVDVVIVIAVKCMNYE